MTVNTTIDAFLGGALEIEQPRNGFRSGIDAVLLAAAVTASPGQTVLELGCGVGAAGLCLTHRVSNIDYTGIELQTDYAEMAAQNFLRNTTKGQIICADLRDLPAELKARSFDHVFANPPYYHATDGTQARDPGRAEALSGQTPLLDWAQTAFRRLRPKGHATFIQRADRLPDLLGAVQQARFGSIELWPFIPRTGRSAQLILLRARKDGRAAFILHAPLILHKTLTHEADRPDYTDQIENTLRHGAGLEWPKK